MDTTGVMLEGGSELWNFVHAFGVLNWFLTTVGFVFYWLVNLELVRSDRKKKSKEFTWSTFWYENRFVFWISFIGVFVGSPIMAMQLEFENPFNIIALGASGGWIFRNALQIAINNYTKPKT